MQSESTVKCIYSLLMGGVCGWLSDATEQLSAFPWAKTMFVSFILRNPAHKDEFSFFPFHSFSGWLVGWWASSVLFLYFNLNVLFYFKYHDKTMDRLSGRVTKWKKDWMDANGCKCEMGGGKRRRRRSNLTECPVIDCSSQEITQCSSKVFNTIFG